MEMNVEPSKMKIEHDICDYHKKHPGANYAGCTCFASYASIKCKHENAHMFHENAPRYCPDCKHYIDGNKIVA